MKTKLLFWISLSLLNSFILSAQDEEYDDIYYNRKDRVYEENKNPSTIQEVPLNEYKSNTADEYYQPQSTSDTSVNERGTTIINNNYNGNNYRFDNEDYYDYAYASRLRRFYNPLTTMTYYDPYYTNMYWYNYDPYFYGTSIYSTYSWWNPRPSWGLSFGGGWGSWWFTPTWSYGWGYNNWGWGAGYCGMPNYGYYGSVYAQPWGWGYNNYAYGYNQGYYNGYNNGLYAGNYYNSYDANSYYYGHRGSTSSNSGMPRRNRSLGEKYQTTYGQRAVNSRFVSDKAVVADVRGINAKPMQVGGKNNVQTPSKAGMPVRNEIRNVHTQPKDMSQMPSKSSANNPRSYQSMPSSKPQVGGVRPGKSNNYSNYGTLPSKGQNTANPRDYHSMPKNVDTRPAQQPRNMEVTPMPEKVDRPKMQVPRDVQTPRNTQTPRNAEPRRQQDQPRNMDAPAPRQESPRKSEYSMPKMNSGSQGGGFGGNQGGGSRSMPNHSGGGSNGGRR